MVVSVSGENDERRRRKKKGKKKYLKRKTI